MKHFSLYYPTSLKLITNILTLQQNAAGFLTYTDSVKCGRNAALLVMRNFIFIDLVGSLGR